MGRRRTPTRRSERQQARPPTPPPRLDRDKLPGLDTDVLSDAGSQPSSSSDAARRIAVEPLLIAGALVFAFAVYRYAQIVGDHRDTLWSMIDLKGDRWFGDVARSRGRLYDVQYEGFLPFLYTPFAAILFMPMSAISYAQLQLLVTTASIAGLVAAVWSACVLAGLTRWQRQLGLAFLVSAFALFTEPVQQTLVFGQINLIIMALVMTDFALRDTSKAKGIGIGIATSFKLTPAIFIVYLLLTRRFDAAKRSLISFGLTIVIGFAVLPSQSARYWLDRRFLDSSRVNTSYLGNQSLLAMMQRIADGRDAIRPIWLLGAIALGVAGVLVAVRLHRGGHKLAGVVVCALTGLLVSPVSWSHHWVYLAPGLVLGLEQIWRRRSAIVAAIVTLVAYTFVSRPVPLGFLWRVPFEDDRELSWTFRQSLLGNYYVIAGLIGLAVAAVAVYRNAGQEPSG